MALSNYDSFGSNLRQKYRLYCQTRERITPDLYIPPVMKLSAEHNALLQKQVKQNLAPLQIAGSTFLSCATFCVAYTLNCAKLRHDTPVIPMIGIFLLAIIAVGSTFQGYSRYKERRPCRTWIVTAISLWAGLMTGCVIGSNYWYMYTAKYFEWKDMASYVDINPSQDKATPFMDAGTLYFKDGTQILDKKALAFRNGYTYCIAPVYLDSLLPLGNETKSQLTPSGFVIPRSGTVDFWAVGTNCCGTSGTPFTCGAVKNPMARSALRVLDEQNRLMYQLAVQEYAATTGLPVKRPMFLYWVEDPLVEMDKYSDTAANGLWINLLMYFFGALLGSYFLHSVLRHWKWA
eukprot:TRINITY_DN81050_c0_g1_i1.p1 TRINITY_DN81050_c0_g1~~TRINITY_DN81050_c0_g1_i1.p1  ORF type:complete len:357 (-),score=46.62 TRINITY_DN81050_c0_g1_i1:34-1074(-)